MAENQSIRKGSFTVDAVRYFKGVGDQIYQPLARGETPEEAKANAEAAKQRILDKGVAEGKTYKVELKPLTFNGTIYFDDLSGEKHEQVPELVEAK